MRICYAYNEYAARNVGMAMCSDQCAAAAAAAGHEVYRIVDGHVGHRLEGVQSVPLEPRAQQRLYFGRAHEYSDRLYSTLLTLDAEVGLDVIEFADAGAPALTAIRSKRLLGQFKDTVLALRVQAPWFANTERATAGKLHTFEETIGTFAEDYCLRHADVLMSSTENVTQQVYRRIGRRPIRTWELLESGCPVLPGNHRLPTAVPEPRPLVTVIIPLFNQGEYLRQAIESVRRSNYHPCEIVVVDDGSTDPCTLETFAEIRDVIKLRKPNGGVASARNAGLGVATGRYVLPLDADDLVHPSYIAAAVAALETHSEIAYLACNARYFGVLDAVYVPIGSIPELMLFMHTDGKCATVYRAEALRSVGGYDESMWAFEDWDLQVALTKAGFRGDVLPADFFYYRRHLDSRVFTQINHRRAELLQTLLRKHSDVLARCYPEAAALLVHLWKEKYEPSVSVRLQQEMMDGRFAERRPAGPTVDDGRKPNIL